MHKSLKIVGILSMLMCFGVAQFIPSFGLNELLMGRIGMPTPISTANNAALNPIINVQPGDILIENNFKSIHRRQFQGQGGQVNISFDYEIVTEYSDNVKFGVFVSVDKQVVYKILPKDHQKTIHINIPNVQKGVHVLGFHPEVSSTLNIKALIKNIKFEQAVQCVNSWTDNLIVNGGFESTACRTFVCLYNNASQQSEQVTGWIPNLQMKIGRGSIFNPRLTTSKIVQLDTNKNNCIKQKLSLKPGVYVLKFQWAARDRSLLSSNGLVAKINGATLREVAPQDYEVRQQTVDFELSEVSGESELQFCDAGTADFVGTTLDNISLIHLNKCPNPDVI